MPTPRQLATLHCAVAKLKMTDKQYRMILKNVADVGTSTKLTNASFEDVMAVMEDRGFANPKDPEYWRNKVRQRGTRGGERMIGKIHALCAGQPYPLGALVRRFSAGRTDQVGKLDPRECYALIEALKQIHERQDKAARQGQLFDATAPPVLSPVEGPPVAHRRHRAPTEGSPEPVTQGSAAHAPDPFFPEEPF